MAKTKRSTASSSDGDARKSVIVTFKPKETRRNKSADKMEILASSCPRAGNLFIYDVAGADAFTVGAPGLPTSIESDSIGFDINLYEAPIVTLKLSDSEIKALKSNPDVSAVEDDGWAHALPLQNLVFEGQPSVQAETVPIGVSQIQAVPAWGCSRGRGIKVAVLDTGIDWNHPDLRPNVRSAISFVPGETAMDGNSHGTHCSGTIAAVINGAGVVGVAPEAWLYGIKVLANSGSGQFSWIIAGINWAIQNKMQIVSMSLGASSAPAALEAICNAAFNAGVLLVAAAGNAGPPPAGQPTSVGFPGRYRNVVAVSAIDSNNVIAPFSSRGPEVEICAPGVQVLSTVPGGGYGQKSGTSMACPHVAGAAAVIWGAHRFATNVQIWNLLGASADNLGNPGWDPQYGYGRVDVDQAALAVVPAPAIQLRP
ncbi:MULTISPECIES: S8 family peptidase [unclassified Variovorax]|uniref:S8 family peptidase n=1 Tax=unclassified Variovorax TaxID=663243 RepID=UPI003ED163CB